MISSISPAAASHDGLPRLIFRIDFGEGRRMGLGTLMLLEGIVKSGSMTSAARAMDMPDRQARDLVEQLNALFLNPIVLAQASGVAALTDFGTRLLDQLRAVDAAVNTVAAPHMATIEAAFR